jgi:hypothetical protein
MRKLFVFISAMLCFTVIFAQAPQKISYQAVIRDASNQLVIDHEVGMRISILQNATTVYSEIQTPTTNANGLVSIEIGGGAGFDTINWSKGTYFIKTEIDPTGRTNYSIEGKSQILSVPYALHAKTAESIVSDINKHYLGELYGGGVIFYLNSTGQHGLICSMIDLSSGICWIPKAFQTVLIGPTAQSDWNGYNNTLAIISHAGQGNTYAAGLCSIYTNADYSTGIYNDWYLPAIDELNKLLHARYEVNKTLDDDGNPETTALVKDFYWSSTEYNNGGALYFSFYNGIQDGFNKHDTYLVRAVRAF